MSATADNTKVNLDVQSAEVVKRLQERAFGFSDANETLHLNGIDSLEQLVATVKELEEQHSKLSFMMREVAFLVRPRN